MRPRQAQAWPTYRAKPRALACCVGRKALAARRAPPTESEHTENGCNKAARGSQVLCWVAVYYFASSMGSIGNKIVVHDMQLSPALLTLVQSVVSLALDGECSSMSRRRTRPGQAPLCRQLVPRPPTA